MNSPSSSLHVMCFSADVPLCFVSYNYQQIVNFLSLLVMLTDRKMKAAKAAFNASIDCGITLVDTAEVYGSRVGN